MTDQRASSGLTQETRTKFRVTAKGRRHYFERNFAIQRRLQRSINDRHATLPKLGQDLITANFLR